MLIFESFEAFLAIKHVCLHDRVICHLLERKAELFYFVLHIPEEDNLLMILYLIVIENLVRSCLNF